MSYRHGSLQKQLLMLNYAVGEQKQCPNANTIGLLSSNKNSFIICKSLFIWLPDQGSNLGPAD